MATSFNNLIPESKTYTDEKISCRLLKEIIYGDIMPGEHVAESDIIKRAETMIGICNRMMIVAFLAIYARWKDELEERDKEFRTAGRICGAFESLYVSETLTLDLIAYTFTEMMIEYANKGKNAPFFGVNDSAQDPNVFQSFVKIYSTFSKCAQKVADVTNTEEMKAIYYKLLHSLEILEKITLREKDGQVWVCYGKKREYSFSLLRSCDGAVKDIQDNRLQTFRILRDGEMISCAYLKEVRNFVHRTNGKRCGLFYSDFDGSVIMPMRIDGHIELDQHLNVVASNYSKKSYANNYRYIQQLSLIITDSISEEVMHQIIDTYDPQYHFQELIQGEVFTPDILKRKQYWDNIIIILMVEEGASNLLSTILDATLDSFQRIIKNMELRFGSKVVSADELQQTYYDKIALERELINTQLSKDTIGEHMRLAKKEIAVKLIVGKIVSLYEESSKEENTSFVETMPMKMNNLERIICEKDATTRIIYINTELEKLFRFVNTFYVSLNAYAVKNSEMRIKYESERKNNGKSMILSNEELTEIKDSSVDAFFVAAKKKAREVSGLTIGTLIKDFIAIAHSYCNYDEPERRRVGENAGHLHSIVGRNYLCNTKKFNAILQFVPTERTSFGIAQPETVIDLINSAKHDGIKYSQYYINKFSECIRDLYRFFVYNQDFELERVKNRQVIYDPIYPYVIKYETKSQNKDGCSIRTCYVDSDSPSDDSEIKILTENHYSIGESYYCLPNAQGSNDRWWIEPFMINCRMFDKVLMDARLSKKTELGLTKV